MLGSSSELLMILYLSLLSFYSRYSFKCLSVALIASYGSLTGCHGVGIFLGLGKNRKA